MQREIEWRPSQGPRAALRYYRKDTPIWRVTWNVVWLTLAQWTPWFGLKNLFLRLAGMKVGKGVAVAFKAQPDILFPQDITLGADTVIGYNTTILCHGYLVDRYARGKVVIGPRVAIGADCTILAGITIGEGAVVAAKSLVNKDIPPGEIWAGVPARRIGTVAERYPPLAPE